ncbi:hypothetical protein BDR06DRAFT_969142 [Suillus hirtellus]|nr:hypothetical protein BDR06DRAFT_969142 [Suillus hirtellus]
MASNSVPGIPHQPVVNIEHPQEFKTKFHPCSGHETLYQRFEEFGIIQETQFSEIALETGLNKGQVNRLLNLITHIVQALDNAAAELTPFIKHGINVSHKKEQQVFKHVYKYNSIDFECSFNELWMGDWWWDIQSHPPPDLSNTASFCFILSTRKHLNKGNQDTSTSKQSTKDAQATLNVYKHSKTQGEKLLKVLDLCAVVNVFWFIEHHDAISIDRLHTMHSGMGGKHLFGELKTILDGVRCEAIAAVEKFYLQLDSLIGLDVHIEWKFVMLDAKFLVFDTALKVLGDATTDESDDISHIIFDEHIKFGSPQNCTTIQNIEARLGIQDQVFQGFCRKFSDFVNTSLPTYGYQLMRWVTIPADFQIHEHHYLKINYEITVDWR